MYNLNLFRTRVRELYRRAIPYDDARRATVADLAEAVGLSRSELGKRLNATTGAKLTSRDARAIVRVLCEWGAITTRAEVWELLNLSGAPDFSAAEWASPPLDSLAPATPPTRLVAALVSNLPQPLTEIIGRKREVGEVAARLDDARLITVIGMGGVGKTRVALEVARKRVTSYDSVHLVELASLHSPDLVYQAVAHAMRVKEEPNRPLDATLLEALNERSVLLVLDNCEHLISSCAEVVHQLLSHTSQLRILATSRERLKVDGEVVMPLEPLSLPPVGIKLYAEQLARYEAVQLFMARAGAVSPKLHLSQSNAAAVREIVSHLDGLPLAIELTAARVGMMSLTEIAERLANRFTLLADGPRSAPDRHQTLYAALDWSYNLLSLPEQSLLRNLATFVTTFSLSAVEAVAGEDAIHLLSGLVDKSIIRRDSDANVPQTSYHMLEMVREYALLRLKESGEEQRIRQIHAEFYLDIVERAELELTGTNQVNFLHQLEAAYPNIRAALTWFLEESPHQALRMAKALWRFWYVRGYLAEGRQLLADALQIGEGVDPILAADAFNAAGNLALFQSDYTSATIYYRRSLQMRRSLGEPIAVAQSLNNLGTLALYQGNYEAARMYFEESLIIKRQLADQLGIAYSLNNLGVVARMQGDYRKASAYYDESRDLARSIGDERILTSILHNLGNVARWAGDYPVADAYYRESLELKLRRDDKPAVAISLEGFADLATAQGLQSRAIKLYAAAAMLRRTIGIPVPDSEIMEVDRDVARLRAIQGADEFSKAWGEGEALSEADAIAYALA